MYPTQLRLKDFVMGEGLSDHEVPSERVSTQCYAWTGGKGKGNVGTAHTFPSWARVLNGLARTGSPAAHGSDYSSFALSEPQALACGPDRSKGAVIQKTVTSEGGF